MKSTIWTSFAALVAMGIIGCGSSGPEDRFVAKPPETIPPATITPGNETSLMPLDKGNQWTYAVQVISRVKGQVQPMKSYESVWTVTDSKQTANGIEATIESTSPSDKKSSQKWRSNSKGIYELSDGNPPVMFNPPFPVILFPVKNETVYKWSGTGPNGTKTPGPQTSVRTIRASQVVDTEMGQMAAIPVDDSGTLVVSGKKGTSISTIWFAPGVGIVRFRQEVVVSDAGYVLLLKLKSKSLMKS
jgi:hypothetical protein